jgi:hypothetical protein
MKFIKGYIGPGIVVATIIALIIGLRTKDWYFALYLSIGITTLIMFWIYIASVIGKRKQESIINSDLFQVFVSSGYLHENFGGYHGIIGKKDGHSIRIYYDWNKLARGFFSTGDLKIILYFMPLVNNFESLDIETERVTSLQEKYGSELYYGVRKFFAPDRLVFCINYYPWTSAKRVKSKINKGLEILKKENLLPLDLGAVPSELKDHQINDGFLPNTELIFEYLVEKNR